MPLKLLKILLILLRSGQVEMVQ